MKTRRWMFVLLMAGSSASIWPQASEAQCCLDAFFAGCGSCFRKAPPAYAVAPIMAPVAAPIAAPPPPVVVPVQQVSYVPETTYRTQYQSVPVTSYKPSCEIDPCTGCPRECMEQVTNYVQQAVNVPVTQYRAVYSTKYVQMQQGAPAYGAPAAAPAYPGMAPVGAAASPFAAPVQTTPQAWGAAGADIPQQIVPGQTSIAAPTLPQGFAPQGAAQPGMQPTFQQPAFQQQIVPQSGNTYAAPGPINGQLQPTAPPALAPALAPTPSLKPIPEMPRTPAPPASGQFGNQFGSQFGTPAGSQAGTQAGVAPQTYAAPSLKPVSPPSPAPGTSGMAPTNGANGNLSNGAGTNGGTGPNQMPVVPGTGPGAATGAFPRLLEPTSHTTSWQPMNVRPTAYPTAALPGRLQ